jgi:hypothetical protein
LVYQAFFRILKYKNEEVMKKLLVMLLFSTAMFSQTIKVRGVTLSYDKVNLTMTLNIPQMLMRVHNKDEQIRIVIDKEYSLKKYIAGYPVLTSTNYFVHQGYFYSNMSMFETNRPANCIILKDNLIFKFINVEKGEYTLQVSNLCDWKWESNVNVNSIIIK